MRKTSVALVACAVLFLGLTVAPTTAAAPPRVTPGISRSAAEGVWTWVVTVMDVWKETPRGVQFASGSEDGTWTGTFEGSSVDTFGAELRPDGLWALLAISFEGTVLDKTGTLEILTTAVANDPDRPMRGRWTIISGTGDLANVRGQGTWVIDAELDGARYSGIVREFVPAT
jgi:hypothetical protein